MLRLTLTKDITFPYPLQAGRYLVDPSTAGELLQYCPDDVRVIHVDVTMLGREIRPIDDRPSMIIVRPGGFGDILFLEPVVRALRAREPGLQVSICCFEQFREACGGIGVDWVAYPLAVEDAEQADVIVTLDGSVERDPAADETHIVDVFAARCALELPPGPEHRQIRLDPGEARIEAMQERYKRGLRPRLGIQVESNAIVRTYPPKQTNEVIHGMKEAGWEIFLFGAPGTLNTRSDDLWVNLTKADPPLSFLDSCAVITTCDVFLAPDSALCHAAGALGVPTVALYGPFDWRYRTSAEPSIRALSGKAPCAPCFHHVRYGSPFVPGMPCEKEKQCVAMANIAPARVITAIKSLRRRS